MSVLQSLLTQNPAAVWLAVAALFVTLEVATGSGRLIWPALAALAPAALDATHRGLGGFGEVALFLALSGAALASVLRPSLAGPFRLRTPTFRPRRAVPALAADIVQPATRPSPRERATKPVAPPFGVASRSRTLIGGLARTTGEFANGVGRVWIDGAEWGAELDHGDELEPDRSVEVVGVSGGVRLTVRPLPLPA